MKKSPTKQLQVNNKNHQNPNIQILKKLRIYQRKNLTKNSFESQIKNTTYILKKQRKTILNPEVLY